MSKTFAFLLLPFLLLTQPARGVTPSAPPLALTHVTVIDVSGALPEPDMTVVFATGRIAAVGKTGHLRVPAHARVIEATGRFLIPGLWDMHAHPLDLNGYEWIFPLLIANGVTGIREMGSDLPFDRVNEIRQGVLDGRIVGPRFWATTGRILDGPGTQLREAWTVATADEARRRADEYKHQGMDFVKPYDLLSRDVYLALVHEAKRQRLAVAGHVPFTMSAAEVSDAGQISIEHNTGIAIACSRDEDALRGELVDSSATHFGVRARQPIERKAMMTYDEQKARALFGRFAKNGTWMCPTMIMSPVINAQKPESEARMKYIPAPLQQVWRNIVSRQDTNAEARSMGYQWKLAVVGLMDRTGVGLLAGTDFGSQNAYVFAGFSLHDELARFVEAGLTPREALQKATVNPAKFLGREKDFGRIEKGQLADAVVLDANPLEDIANTRRINAVVLNGRYFDRKELDEMLADAEAMARRK